ncbi:MAG: isoamylase early set domain-containing protein [Lewinellaceae bacterium]|nr:isoamylase early set domain-containing protein [Saprospiraceae bacterium]MCB9345520.1 isoamylase early set domain-containing protein [Lewinellaceae bacterium]
MATKKVTAKTVEAVQPAKTAKAAKTASPVAEAKTTKSTAKKAVAKKAAPAAKSATTTDKAVSKKTSTAKVTFSLPKEAVENAETVAVLGDFNNWQNGTSLKKQKDGSFQTSIELEKGRSYEFRFLINGEKWENAWNAEAYKATPFGAFNSVVTA